MWHGLDMARRRRSAPLDPATAARSAVELALEDIYSARLGLAPVTVGQLPIAQGLAQLHADTTAAMRLLPVDELTGRVLPDDDRRRRWPILTQPDPDEPLGDTLHKLVLSLWWTGNAWALVSWPPTGRAPALALKVLNPETVALVPDMDDPLRAAGWIIDGRTYGRSEVLHLKLLDDPRTGPLGTSPLERTRATLELYGYAYHQLGTIYRDGGLASLVLKSGLPLDGTEAAELADEWIAARHRRRPAVLPPELTLEVPQGDGGSSALTDVLGFCAAEVCRATNTPPSLGNAPSASTLTYANLRDELLRWLVLSLGPTYLARLERAFSSLLPRGTVAKLDTSALVRPELLTATGEATPAPVSAPAEEVPA